MKGYFSDASRMLELFCYSQFRGTGKTLLQDVLKAWFQHSREECCNDSIPVHVNADGTVQLQMSVTLQPGSVFQHSCSLFLFCLLYNVTVSADV